MAVADGRLLGAVPKQFVPNYKEFYESRWFSSATGKEAPSIALGGREVPFGIDLLFEAGRGVVVGIEVCEDLWASDSSGAKNNDLRRDGVRG